MLGPVSNIVYKIMDGADWQQAKSSGFYAGSAHDLRDGFIHLSFANQVEATAERHFKNCDGLLLIAFPIHELGEALRLELSRGGDLFPHLYAPLPAAKALWERSMPLGNDGVPRAAGEIL